MFFASQPPPRSTLFPYTTLFRSDYAVERRLAEDAFERGAVAYVGLVEAEVFAREVRRDVAAHLRSEEHTSELQSRQYLVCRLLLEKKKMLTRGTTNCTRYDAAGA